MFKRFGESSCIFEEHDVTDKDQWERVWAVAEKFFKSKIDILVNNAGVCTMGAVVEANYDSWDKMIDVNIRSHLHLLGEFLPGMKERGTGHVVNITSVAEMDPAPILAVYCGTKHFWTGFSAALR